jgi:outer membrane lipoprotein SlyB
METVIGIFPSRQEAIAAAQELRSTGVAEEQLALVEPQSSLAETPSITPPQPDAPGACGANAENVQGSILGFASGLLGSTILVLALPGIGPIAAVGALGLGSAVGSLAGGVVGQAARQSTTTELTPQEFVAYEHALKRGQHLLVVQHDGANNTQTISELMARHSAEDVSRAREHWWKHIRAGEVEAFAGSPKDFSDVERRYRDGFEAALAAYGRQSVSNATPAPLPPDHAPTQDEVFEQGYARGRLYYEALLRQYAQKEEQQASS